MKITNYHIVTGDAERIAASVRQMMRDGWQPLGTAFAAPAQEFLAPTCAQTMVKYEDSPDCCGGAQNTCTCTGGEQ